MKQARRIQRSIYLSPEQDSLLQAAKPDGMGVSDFLRDCIIGGVDKVKPPPTEPFDEWGLISQLIRDDGDITWLSRVRPDFFAQDIPREVVRVAEETGLKGNRLKAAIGKTIKAIDLEPAKVEEYEHLSPHDVQRMAKSVTDAYVRRLLIVEAAHAANALLSEKDPTETLARLGSAIASIHSEERGTAIVDALRDMALEAKRHAEEDETGSAVRFHFEGLDYLIPRMGGGEVHIVAARTNVGKSLIASNIARNNAAAGNPVAIFSLEMKRSLFAERIASVESGEPSRTLDGHINLSNHKFLEGCQAISKLPIHIDDRAGLSPAQIGNAIGAMHPAPRLVIIDYFGLIKHPDSDSSVNSQGATMKDLLLISKRYGIPIILLGQINREGDKETKPRISNLRGCGELEQDASSILLGRALDDSRERTAWEMAKNRVLPRFGEVELRRVNGSARMVEVRQ